jgi:hypothetical protein
LFVLGEAFFRCKVFFAKSSATLATNLPYLTRNSIKHSIFHSPNDANVELWSANVQPVVSEGLDFAPRPTCRAPVLRQRRALPS